MRKMASPDHRHLLPKSLMQRLALVAIARREPLAASRQGRLRSGRTRVHVAVRFWFCLGALAGGGIGSVAFLGLHALAASEIQIEGDAAGVVPQRLGEARPETFDIAIDRSERARAPLRLQVAGTEDPNIEVMLQGIPAAARLSRGERRGALSWVLKRADLDGLYLMLGDAAPDAFDIRIDVLAPTGVATQGAVVRVRLLDQAAPKQPPIIRSGNQKAVETTVAAVSDVAVGVAAWQPKALAGPWPEGVNGVQVWWKIPPPSWSPFGAAAQR